MKYLILILAVVLIGCADNSVGIPTSKPIQAKNTTAFVRITLINGTVETYHFTDFEFTPIVDNQCAYAVSFNKESLRTIPSDSVQSFYSYLQ